MIASSRTSGLDIPFLEMEPIRLGIGGRQTSRPDAEELQAGELIADRYRVLRKIGEGGMGVLYACEDTVLARQVAVKLMQRTLVFDPVLCERLLREARLAAQLRKHVAQVFDCGTLAAGEPYIVMELLTGSDLYSVLRDFGPLPAEEVASDMLEVCVGLAEAHDKGIIHRDLKPENLFRALDPDGSTHLKIVDFGISKQLSSRRLRSQTDPSESVGSPQYMSPEQITASSDVDSRTDIWSLGVVMFELLTGALPFDGPGPAQVCAAVLTQPVPPFTDYTADVPPALEAIILRCLEKDRTDRFLNVGELAAALSAFAHLELAQGGVAVRRRAPAGVRAGRSRRRWLGALCSAVTVGLCTLVLVAAVRDGRLRVPSRTDVTTDMQRLSARITGWHLPFAIPSHAP